jgi:hypothetical protein
MKNRVGKEFVLQFRMRGLGRESREDEPASRDLPAGEKD